ncbi:MAG: hypothetical protein DMF75_05390 [Acidobacteria bacterium]|nr:MAG: hypothetical protein DMF75_05390 [Acidobacteriota bacterium]
MPPIWWNDSFVSLRCVINNIEDFFEVFISAFSDHRILRFSPNIVSVSCRRTSEWIGRGVYIQPSIQSNQL